MKILVLNVNRSEASQETLCSHDCDNVEVYCSDYTAGVYTYPDFSAVRRLGISHVQRTSKTNSWCFLYFQ